MIEYFFQLPMEHLPRLNLSWDRKHTSVFFFIIIIFNLILFFNFTILYWFCHISKWICHRYTCVPHPEPSSLLPPHTILLDSPMHPVSCIEPGLATRFIYDIIHVSIPFSQIVPPSPSPTESKRLIYTSVSLLLSCIQGYLNDVIQHMFSDLIGINLEINNRTVTRKCINNLKLNSTCLNNLLVKNYFSDGGKNKNIELNEMEMQHIY